MSSSNSRKTKALGMPLGTAAHKLRKSILFKYVVMAGDNVCFKCGELIRTEGELSIEHKNPWLYAKDSVQTFFDLDNIAFSHIQCNRSDVSRRKEGPEGTAWCSDCKKFLDKDMFTLQRNRWNGVYNKCKSCRSKERA